MPGGESGLTIRTHFMESVTRMSSPRLIFLATLSLVLFSASGHLHAGASNKSGNPFGNGTFFQNTGTFSAVVRGQNLSGTMIFSTGANTNTSTNSATGSSSGTTTISYLGDATGSTPGIYNGNAVGMWDPSSGSISGQLWGGVTLSGSGTLTVYPDIANPQAISVGTNTIYVTSVGTDRYNDTAYMSGNFSGNTANTYPNQTFTASGTLLEQELAPQADTTGSQPLKMGNNSIAITVQGLRISDNYSSFSTVSNSIPYSTTTYSYTNIGTF